MRRTCLTLIVLAACRDRPPAPPPPTPPPPHDGVTLIQPGTPPLQSLRYHLTKGSKIASELLYDTDLKTAGAGGPMPTQVVQLETAVDDVAADGAARLRITVVDVSVRDSTGSATGGAAAAAAGSAATAVIPGRATPSDVMQAQAAALRGVVITETLAPDGQVSDAKVDGAASDKLHRDLDSVLRSLEQVATRLPAELVGVGATWRERRTLPDGGVRGVSEMTYTLTSLTGTVLAYTSVGQLTGGPQTVEQDGTKVEVTDTHGTSTATGSVDLARYALDVTAASSFATTMNVVGASGGSAPGSAAGSAAATADAGASTIEIATKIRLTSTAPSAADQGAHSAP